MLSLYIHIPFCAHKCAYCSFFVMPENELESNTLEKTKELYLTNLFQEIDHLHAEYGTEQIRTIYIGGGTPLQLGTERLFTIIDYLLEKRDCEFLEELSIELNPDPFDQVLAFVKTASDKYSQLYRLRFSVGIQSFDDEILQASKRNYGYNNLINFFRELQSIKKPHVSYNADFIAFGKFTQDQQGNKTLRTKEKRQFFTNLVDSHMFDGFSLYTLELFPGSNWYNDTLHTAKHIQKHYGDEEAIMLEFHILKNIIEHAGYRRYELSNFAFNGKESIHNMVYWQGGSYLGIGINSASYLNQTLSPQGPIRYKNTHQRKAYAMGNYKDTDTIEQIPQQEQLRESALFYLRTGKKILLDEYQDILEKNRQDLSQVFDEEGLVEFDQENNTLSLTNPGMDLYNHIVTELFTIQA